MPTEPPCQAEARQSPGNQGPLTVLGTRFVPSRLLNQLQQRGSRPLHGGQSRVAKQDGVLAPCHGKGEDQHIMSPVASAHAHLHTRAGLLGSVGKGKGQHACCAVCGQGSEGQGQFSLSPRVCSGHGCPQMPPLSGSLLCLPTTEWL